jgi:hypothetical protein
MPGIANPVRPLQCPCGGFWPDKHAEGCTNAEMAKLWPKAYEQELQPAKSSDQPSGQ